MNINSVNLQGFRNYSDAHIRLSKNTLIIGANDVGKTNFIYAMRLLLDKSLSDLDIEPKLNDFHINANGVQSERIEILIEFDDVKEDAVLSRLGGDVSDKGKTFIKYVADKSNLQYKMFIGHKSNDMREMTSRFYLKYLNLRYVTSQRDLSKYISLEKRHLLKLAKEARSEEEREADKSILDELTQSLKDVNNKVKEINYVSKATSELNDELKKLSYQNDKFSVQLDSGAIGIDQFIEKLELSSNTNGKKVMLGGDGFNNQILLALWKAKSVREHDLENEVVIYCVEEPESHLYPHQQRKLSQYLIDKLPGQSIVTTHSPQITTSYSPDSIIKICSNLEESYAASEGCSNCISKAWDGMGYRISILPAEAFFANVVLLVEGPSELLFYHELSKALNIDLDLYNISILSVDGVQFEVYIKILEAFEIQWVARTDNDHSKVPHKQEWQYSGLNRALSICRLPILTNEKQPIENLKLQAKLSCYKEKLNSMNVFVAFKDLEGDLSEEFSYELQSFTGASNNEDAAKYLRGKKATRMRELLKAASEKLIQIKDGELARPLIRALKLSRGDF